MMYGGEPTPNSAPAPPPARPAGMAHERDRRPSGCRPKMFWKPTNMVNAHSATSTGFVGNVRSAKAPTHAPIMPAGSNTLISAQFAFLLLVLPRITEAVKSSASTSGMAKCRGCDNASSGTEMRPEPKPVMPRMKYALIKMHSTSTISAIFLRPLQSVNRPGASIACTRTAKVPFTYFCNQGTYVFVCCRKFSHGATHVCSSKFERYAPGINRSRGAWHRPRARGPGRGGGDQAGLVPLRCAAFPQPAP